MEAALARPHLFIGSYGRMLEAMDSYLPVSTVIAPKGRLRDMRLEHRLRERGVNWLEISDREQLHDALDSLTEPGYCGVAGFSWRIPQSLISSCEGVLNFHPGDLLCCRGPDPVAAALYHRHSQLGACTHLIDSEDFDSGPLLERDLLDVDPGRGYSWHKQRVMQLLEEQARRLFSKLADGGELSGQSWDVEASTWHPKLSATLLKELYIAPRIDVFQRNNPPA